MAVQKIGGKEPAKKVAKQLSGLARTVAAVKREKSDPIQYVINKFTG